MLSRVANSLYWMSRYLERADNVARFVRVNAHLMLDLGLDSNQARWLSLIYASGDHEEFRKKHKISSESTVLRFLTFDAKNQNSILSCVASARENARTVREHLPSEIWEAINELFHFTLKHRRRRFIEDLQEFYEHFQGMGHMITGYAEDMLAHHEAWHFIRLGRMLERADKTARLLDIKYFFLTTTLSKMPEAYDTLEWAAVLKSVNANDMYRKKYHIFNYRNIANFLIFDPFVPRSINYCVNAASDSLDAIIGDSSNSIVARQEMDILKNSLETSDVDQVLLIGVHDYIDVFQYNLNIVDEAIYKSFFLLDQHSVLSSV